jgi:uncharacterized membrane protein
MLAISGDYCRHLDTELVRSALDVRTEGRVVEIGPVEYIVIDFPGNRFQGEIAPAIADLVERGLVRIIDLVFVKNDRDGRITWFEFDDLEETATFGSIDAEVDGVMSDRDIAEIAATVPLDSSALVIVWEDLWAAELGKAVRGAGGELVAGGRIPHDVAIAALAGLDA